MPASTSSLFWAAITVGYMDARKFCRLNTYQMQFTACTVIVTVVEKASIKS